MSRGFNFRLQKVLEYRKEKEKQAQRKLSEARVTLMMEEGRLKSLKDDLNSIQITGQGEEDVFLDLQEAISCCHYMDYLDGCIDEQVVRISEKRGVVEKKRSETLERSRDSKVLSTLKEKQYFTFCQDVNLKEQKLSDEFALSAYYRRSLEEE